MVRVMNVFGMAECRPVCSLEHENPVSRVTTYKMKDLSPM